MRQLQLDIEPQLDARISDFRVRDGDLSLTQLDNYIQGWSVDFMFMEVQGQVKAISYLRYVIPILN